MENTQNETGAVRSAQPEADDTSLFAVGSVLSITWKTLFKNPVVFCGLTILILTLTDVVQYALPRLITGISIGYFAFLQMFIPMLLGQWIGGAIAYGAYQTLKGNRASLGASLFHGTRHFVPLICVGVLITLAIGATIVLGTILGPVGFLVFPFTAMMACTCGSSSSSLCKRAIRSSREYVTQR